MSETGLHHGEVLLAEWRPEFRVFARKLIVVGAITTLALGGVGGLFGGWQSILIAIVTFPVVMAFYIFIFDDYDEWPRRRDDLWRLTNTRLLFSNSRDETQNSEIPLVEITRVRTWLSWALHVRLVNRRTIVLSYLRDNSAIRTALQSAISQAQRGTNDGT